MRTLPLLSIVAILSAVSACDDTQSTTAPTRGATAVPSPSAQISTSPTTQSKTSKGTITVVTSGEVEVPGGAGANSVACPAGTLRVGGGYDFTNEGNWSPVSVTMNSPLGENGWFVRVVNAATGHTTVAFKVYALCQS